MFEDERTELLEKIEDYVARKRYADLRDLLLPLEAADIAALIGSAWPEAEYLEFNWWDMSRRCLSLWSFVPLAGEPDVSGTAWRTLYFDGEALLLYQDTATYTDHVADSIDVPETVLAAAQARVLEELGWWQTHSGGQTYVDGEWQDVGTPAEWDDWRITSLKLVDEAPAYPELGIKVYSYSYELHTTTPARAVIAGGMYLDEDGWAWFVTALEHLAQLTGEEDGTPCGEKEEE